MSRGGLIYRACALMLLPPALAAAPPIVMEAEHANDLRLNYEIKEADDASNGRVLSAWEGAGVTLTWGRSNVDSDVFIGRARLVFDVEEPGAYFLSARIFFMDKCGNSLNVRLDDSRPMTLGPHDSETDLLGKWHWEKLGPFHLDRGFHTIEHMVLEDGVLLDQWCVHAGSFHPRGKLEERWPGQFRDKPLRPMTVSFAKESELIRPDGTVPMTLWVRKIVSGAARGSVLLKGPEDMRVEPAAELPVRFEPEEVLKPIEVTARFPAETPRSEKLIRAHVTDENGRVMAVEPCIVARPYDWWVLGPVTRSYGIREFAADGRPRALADLLAGRPSKEEAGPVWKRLPREVYNPYQTMDLEKLYGLREYRAAYLYTEMEVPESGKYLALINNDCQVRMWIDGRPIYRDQEHHPAEGWIRVLPLRLDAGRHSILVRSQDGGVKDGRRDNHYWLFRLRLRNKRTEPSAIAGAECERSE